METQSEINQELEEFLQSIEDELYNTKIFNVNLENEIRLLFKELEGLSRVVE